MQSTKTDKTEKLRINDQLCFALYSASRAITKAYSVLLDELDVTYPQYLALLMLWEGDGILVSDIARALEIDAGTATPLIQRLEKIELVTRIRCDQDERRVRVYLTEKGKAYYQKALAVPHGLGKATGLDNQNSDRIIEEMNDIKSAITQWMSSKET